jgi:nucleoside-diphosphate-sugar epimerase
MRRVLVTGASGFIGRHCLKPLLDRGFEVHGASRGCRPPEVPAHVEWHSIDLLEAGTASRLLNDLKPTHLLHLAWYAIPGKYWTAPENLDWVRAGIELVRAFAESGGKRIVIAGSCAEYDWSHGILCEESTPLKPSTLYGTCKNALREVVEKFAPVSGLSWAWGRIFNLYGPWEDPRRLVPSVALSLLRGGRARCTEGEQVRDYLFVDDVAEALTCVLDSKAQGAVNIGSGEGIKIRSLVERLAGIIGSLDRVDFGVLPTPGNEPSTIVAETSRLRAEAEWVRRWSLDRGLEQSVRWWRERLPVGDL